MTTPNLKFAIVPRIQTHSIIACFNAIAQKSLSHSGNEEVSRMNKR